MYSSGGTVNFSDCTFSDNVAQGGRGANYQRLDISGRIQTDLHAAGAARGGALHAAAGQVTVAESTFLSNRALGGRNYQYLHGNNGRAGVGQGGGIFSTATLTLTNDTFASNAALGGDEGIFRAGEQGFWRWSGGVAAEGYGGGLFTGGGAATVTATTFAGNSAYGGYGFDGVLGSPIRALGYGGGLLNQGAQVTLADSILTGNLAGHGGLVSNSTYNNEPPPDTTPSGGTERNVVNSAGSLTGDHNLIRDGSGGLGDTIAADPMLAPLANYGGPTQTRALLPGSPAIGAGAAHADVTADQRGVARTGRFDIGAFQSRGFNVAAGGGDGQSTYVGTTFVAPLTATVSSAFGEPVAGGRVTFTAVPSASGASAGLSGSVVTIAADGSASVTATANPTAGTHQVAATTSLAAAASFTLSNTLAPTDLTPTTFADNPFSTSLRGGIVAFNHDPDAATHTINLASGTYSLALGKLAITSTAHTLIIRGQGATGAGATVIDADASSRIFRVVNPGTTVLFDNLQIKDGLAAQGGGVSNGGGNLTFTNVVFDSNTAQGAQGTGLDEDFFPAAGENGSGGGLYSTGGSISIVDSTFSNNKAVGGKGADGGPDLPGGFGGAGRGAGLYSGGGSVTITGSTFAANSAAGGEGADSFDPVFPGLRRTQGGYGGVARGGGVYAGGGSVMITNSTFASDSAVGGNGGRGSAATAGALAGNGGQGGGAQGGGLYSLASTTVSGATFASTAVRGIGGPGGARYGVYPAGQPGRAGEAQGGGLDVAGGSTTLNNSIVVGTTDTAAATSGGTLFGSHNLIQDGSGGPGLTATLTGNPLLAPLADNGGPTQTMALLTVSPAIDAGSNALIPAGVTADQRGLPRRHNDLVDIGAFEDQTAPLTVSTSTTTTSSATASTYGGSVTFTATVTGSSTPQGGVSFVIDSGTPVAGDFGGTTGGNATWTYTAQSLPAGSHTVEAFFDGSVGFNDSNGTLGGGHLVNKANATVVVTPYAVTYDGSAHTATVTSITGVNGETGATVGAVTLSGPQTNAGTYSDAWSFAGNTNYYDIASTAITNVINKAASAVVVTVNDGPFTYAGLAQAPATVRVTGAGGLSLTPAASYTNNVNAGTATASYTFAGDANHTGGSNSKTFTIAKADATVVVTPYAVTYDGGPHAATYTISGVNSEAGVAVGAITLSGPQTNAGTYSDAWSFAGTANYNDVAATTITNTINKAASAVVVTVNGGPFTYTGSAQTPATVTVTGAGGLSLTPAASYSNNVNAGTATASYSYPGDANHEAGSAS